MMQTDLFNVRSSVPTTPVPDWHIRGRSSDYIHISRFHIYIHTNTVQCRYIEYQYTTGLYTYICIYILHKCLQYIHNPIGYDPWSTYMHTYFIYEYMPLVVYTLITTWRIGIREECHVVPNRRYVSPFPHSIPQYTHKHSCIYVYVYIYVRGNKDKQPYSK